MTRLAGVEKVGIKVRIPKVLHDQVTLLMLDPLRMRVGYGNWTSLMTRLLQKWVDEQIQGARDGRHGGTDQGTE